MNEMELTPKQIVAELDKYIVGQSEAKKSVAIALRNRWRRKNLSEDMQTEKQKIIDTLKGIDYEYDESRHQFV